MVGTDFGKEKLPRRRGDHNTPQAEIGKLGANRHFGEKQDYEATTERPYLSPEPDVLAQLPL